MAASVRLVARLDDTPPEPGAFIELDEGLFWLRLPIPGPLRHINVWLLDNGDGWTLVDTGMCTASVEQAWQLLERELAPLAALNGILVTHHHPDHFGMARWLCERRDVAVRMSRAAAAAARIDDGDDPSAAPDLDAFAARLGFEFEAEGREIVAGRRYRSVVSGTPPFDAPLSEGECLATTAGSFTVSLHDGHAPGHACLHAADTSLLISGDQVLPTISPNISLYPGNEDSDPLGDYLASLEKLSHLPGDTVVLPAHGRPFRTLHPRIEALQAGHESRLQKITLACAEPLGTMEIVEELFNLARLDGLNRLLATTEALAHLRHLERRGEIAADGAGAALRWRRL
jgi:glyoxylase-like metal-dependent hydrolase (beta-lactamase superfamily II)